MNWSMMICAPFAKSPNCASQQTNASEATEYPYSNPSAAYSESTVSYSVNGAWSSATCARGMYSRSLVWSTITAWRWAERAVRGEQHELSQ